MITTCSQSCRIGLQKQGPPSVVFHSLLQADFHLCDEDCCFHCCHLRHKLVLTEGLLCYKRPTVLQKVYCVIHPQKADFHLFCDTTYCIHALMHMHICVAVIIVKNTKLLPLSYSHHRGIFPWWEFARKPLSSPSSLWSLLDPSFCGGKHNNLCCCLLYIVCFLWQTGV